MAAAAAVRVHVGHDVESRAAEQGAGRSIRRVEQPFEEAFHPPSGHGLARMLAPEDPAARRPFRTSLDQVEGLAVEGFAQAAVAHAGRAAGARDQGVVAGHRVGREIGEPRLIARGAVADGQHRAVEFGRDTRPVSPVLRSDGAVAAPAFRVGRGAGVLDPEHAIAPARAPEPEEEPLEEFRAGVRPDCEPDVVGRDGREATDVAAVEITVDRKAHGFQGV